MQWRTQNRLRRITVIWLVIISLNALAAGYSLMSVPTGKGLGIPLSYLHYSPFKNFLVPGIVLFSTIGLLSMVTAILGIKKHVHYPHFLFVQGCVLLGWIVIQIGMLRVVNVLHIICGVSALVWMGMGVLLWKAGQGNEKLVH